MVVGGKLKAINLELQQLLVQHTTAVLTGKSRQTDMQEPADCHVESCGSVNSRRLMAIAEHDTYSATDQSFSLLHLRCMVQHILSPLGAV